MTIKFFEPQHDPVMALAGWKQGSTSLRTAQDVLETAPYVTGGLMASAVVVFILCKLLLEGSKSLTAKAPPFKEMAFCLVGSLFHMYLGPAALFAAWNAMDMPYAEGAGNREALAASKVWIDTANSMSVLGELFTGYAVYIMIMWVLGWEERGKDKLVHHCVFLFLGLCLSTHFALPKLSVFAISMELSTPFLNLSIIFGWFNKKWCKVMHLVMGVLFIVLFFAVRIFFFGYALFTTLAEFHADPSVVPLPFPLACFVLFLYSGGWGIQVYWTKAIFAKMADVFGLGGKKEKEH